MRHARLRDQLGDYVDGLLSSREAARLERHMAGCADCRSELEAVRRTLELLRELPPVEAPPDLAAGVLAAIEEANRPAGSWLRGWGTPLLTASVAAVAVLLLVQGVEVSIGWPASAPPLPASELQSVTLEAAAAPLTERVALFAPAPPPIERPSVAACLTAGHSLGEACRRWHSWMLDLGSRDPSTFASEFDAVPESDRALVWDEFRELAWGTGSASVLIDRLRSSGDPRASSLARRLTLVSAR